jgi:hypothetical protein
VTIEKLIGRRLSKQHHSLKQLKENPPARPSFYLGLAASPTSKDANTIFRGTFFAATRSTLA